MKKASIVFAVDLITGWQKKKQGRHYMPEKVDEFLKKHHEHVVETWYDDEREEFWAVLMLSHNSGEIQATGDTADEAMERLIDTVPLHGVT
jgi:hypothetical protein